MAAKNCPLLEGSGTKSQFKTEMQEVLRATKQRFRNKMKKTPQSDIDDDDDDPQKFLLQTQRLQKMADECTNEDDRQKLMQEMQRLQILDESINEDVTHTTDGRKIHRRRI